MSKVISFRVDDEVYDFFKNLDKPFSESITPLLIDHMKNIQNIQGILGTCSNENQNKYSTISKRVDRLIALYFNDTKSTSQH